jgi:hypothetical protein
MVVAARRGHLERYSDTPNMRHDWSSPTYGRKKKLILMLVFYIPDNI